jgi:hypothetical protein
MSDYFFKIDQLEPNKLLDEIQQLTKKQMSVRQDTKMWQQIQTYIDYAKENYRAHTMSEALQAKKEPDVIEIGEVEEVVYTPDYSSEELILAVADFYTNDKISKNKEKQQKYSTEKSIPQPFKQTPSIKPEPQPIPKENLDIDIPVFGKTK